MGLARGLASPPAALLAGALQAMSIAEPWRGAPLWWLQTLSLAWLVWQLAHRAGRQTSWSASTWIQPETGPAWRRAFGLAWLFGLGWLAGTFWWLFTSMHTYGGLAAPLAAAGVLALALFLALYYAAVCALFKHFSFTHRAVNALVFAACWLLAELARGVLWTGFPWGASGYAHISGLLFPLARWVGVYGIGAAAAGLAMLLAQVRRSDLRDPKIWAMCGYGAMLLFGLHAQRQLTLNNYRHDQPPLSVALLQGNIPQDEKFQAGTGIPLALQWYSRQLYGSQADLTLAPETAIPLLPQQLSPGYLDGLRSWFSTWGDHRAALVGMPLGNAAQGYTNSVIGWSPAEPSAYRYDKHHLVPFGEFIPPLFQWFVRMMDIPLGEFSQGALVQPSLHWAGERIAPTICYEDLFTEELAARFAQEAQAPTIFANLSNIAWFGDSVAIDQHLHISQMRALEFERPFLRATNTGATAIIDHRGNVVQQLPSAQRAVLTGEVTGHQQRTPYARWMAVTGLWPLAAWALVVLGLALWQHRRGKLRCATS